MSIRIRVYPQSWSVGTRRNRAARRHRQLIQQQFSIQQQLIRQQQLIQQQRIFGSFGGYGGYGSYGTMGSYGAYAGAYGSPFATPYLGAPTSPFAYGSPFAPAYGPMGSALLGGYVSQPPVPPVTWGYGSPVQQYAAAYDNC